MHKPPFDYRRLPRLKSLVCDVASELLPEYLNHPNIERLDLEGTKAKDLTFLRDAKHLRALRLSASPIRALTGFEELDGLRELRLILTRSLSEISALRSAAQLEALELDKTPKITDISSIYGLRNLRWLFINASQAKQRDLNWIRNMPRLECAGIWIETETVDWSVLAEHPRLYDIVFYTTKGFSPGSDEDILAKLSADGRRVKALTRYPRAIFPGFRVEFAPPSDVARPEPHFVYQNHLRY